MHPSDLQLDAVARSTSAEPEVVAHAATCPTCAATLRERRVVLGLLAELPATEPSELEWKRIDRHVMDALERDAQQRSARRSLWYIAIPGVAAAAAALVIVAKLASPVPPVQVVQGHEVVAAAQPAVALAIGGDARTGRSGPEILEGDTLDAASGTLLVQTAPSTGIELAAGGRAKASRLRAGQTEFTLESGELLAEVKPLAPGASFAVKAGDLTVHVVGTQFVVGRTARGLRVAVVHGRVRVDRDGDDAVYVGSGTELTIAEGQQLGGLAPTAIADNLAARFPLAFPELAPDEVERQFGQAEIDSEPAGAQARLDGANRGVTPLTLLAAEGTHEVQLNLPGHKPQRHTLKVSRTRALATLALPVDEPALAEADAPTPTPAAPARKPKLRAAAQPAPRVSYAEAFHSAAATHRDEVEACYAKLGVDMARRLHIVLTVQPTGQVAPPVQVEEPGIDPAFVDCVTGAARTWSFPAPDREYEVTIPYELQPGPPH